MAQRQSSESLESRVASYIKEQHLLTASQPLLLAVSGGPDSVCLLHLLAGLRSKSHVRLHVAHLDHQLRGAESVQDAQYVLDLCHRLEVPVTIGQQDVRAYRAEHRISLEEAAREVRYSFLAEVAKSIGAECVAVAHTLDDHVETVLLHLLRGSGTRGLRGLQPVSPLLTPSGRLTVIRPLLAVSRRETTGYCRRYRLKPRRDVTNLSMELLRNRVRLKLLPRLKDYNPQIVEALLRTARIAGDDIEFLEKSARRQWGRIVSRQGETIIFDRQKLNRLPASLQRYLLRMTMAEVLGTLKDIEARHIEEMVMFLKKPAGKRISLPGGLSFMTDYDRYLLGIEPAKTVPYPSIEEEYPLPVPGTTKIPGWVIRADIGQPAQISTNDPFEASLDDAQAGKQLVVRTVKTGDRFQPLGMSEMKKVRDFMADTHIPRLWRARVPIVLSDRQVLWVVGWRIDDRVKVTKSTKMVLRLKFERVPDG